MKLKNALLSLFAASIVLLGAACSGSKSDKTAEPVVFTVDSLMSAAPALVGDTVIVEGKCSHLCKHGGTKAFLVGADPDLLLRCQATAAMGGAFAPDCVDKELKVVGVVREERLTEDDILEMEARQAAMDSAAAAHQGCSTELKARGQNELTEFEARMVDYRERIADRKADEGRDYLSFYYLEAVSYSVPVAQ